MKHSVTVGLVVLGIFGTSWVGCSSSDDSGGASSCSDFSACGGTPEGTWSLKDLCATGVEEAVTADLPPECANVLQSYSVSGSGSATLNADGSGEVNFSVTTSMSLSVDSACAGAQQNNPNFTMSAIACGLVEAGLGAGEGAAAQCDYVDGVCNCDVTSVQPNVESGTWSVTGTQLTWNTQEPQDFCEKGGTLTTQKTDDSGVVTTLVWQRQ